LAKLGILASNGEAKRGIGWHRDGNARQRIADFGIAKVGIAKLGIADFGIADLATRA